MVGSSLSILLPLKNRPQSALISIDLLHLNYDESYIGCFVLDNLKSTWTIVKQPDKSGIPYAIDSLSQIDMCHYDSDKSYSGRKHLYPLLWSALRIGGIFISDDISDNKAFMEFSATVGKKPFVVNTENTYVGIIVK